MPCQCLEQCVKCFVVVVSSLPPAKLNFYVAAGSKGFRLVVSFEHQPLIKMYCLTSFDSINAVLHSHWHWFSPPLHMNRPAAASTLSLVLGSLPTRPLHVQLVSLVAAGLPSTGPNWYSQWGSKPNAGFFFCRAKAAIVLKDKYGNENGGEGMVVLWGGGARGFLGKPWIMQSVSRNSAAFKKKNCCFLNKHADGK